MEDWKKSPNLTRLYEAMLQVPVEEEQFYNAAIYTATNEWAKGQAAIAMVQELRKQMPAITAAARPVNGDKTGGYAWLEWKQPTGIVDSYINGDHVLYNGARWEWVCSVLGDTVPSEVNGWRKHTGKPGPLQPQYVDTPKPDEGEPYVIPAGTDLTNTPLDPRLPENQGKDPYKPAPKGDAATEGMAEAATDPGEANPSDTPAR